MADLVINESRLKITEKIVMRQRASSNIHRVLFPNPFQVGVQKADGTFSGGLTVFGDLEVKGTFTSAAGGISEADVLKILTDNNYVNQSYLTTFGYITQGTLTSQLGNYASLTFLTANNYITLNYLNSNKYTRTIENKAVSFTSVSSGGTSSQTVSMFTSGSVQFLQLSSSNLASNTKFEIYGASSYAENTLNYRALGISMTTPGSSYVDRIPFCYFAADGSANMYMRVHNNGPSTQTYTLHIVGEGS